MITKTFYEHQVAHLKMRDLIEVTCEFCKQPFKATKRDLYKSVFKRNGELCCSFSCATTLRHRHKNQGNTVIIICELCNTQVIRLESQVKKTKAKNQFCSKKCCAIYASRNKRLGTTRSKLEIYLEQQLVNLYPKLSIQFNMKDTIQSELDIYIPNLKLAFELNGIFHYEPIFSQARLEYIQNNDNRKFQACLEQGIELCIINSSKQKQVNEKTSKKYLDIITQIINSKLNEL
jgi:predicted nucleic acid-binding Zn ribbon protein